MPGMPHAPKAGRQTGHCGMDARRADLDPAGRPDTELGGKRAGIGGLAQLHRGSGGKSPGRRDWAERGAVAPSDVHLSHVAAGRASDCGVLEVIASRSPLNCVTCATFEISAPLFCVYREAEAA